MTKSGGRAQKLIIAPFYSLKVVIKLAGSFTILLEYERPGKLQRVIFFYNIRRQLVKDFEQFARSMRAQYIIHGENSDLQPLHVKSDWIPPIQPSVMLESYLEEVKISLANIQVRRPKDNLPHRERRALKDLTRNKNIVLKKADKGTATVKINRQDKIEEGQSLLDDRNKYRPLVEPTIESTSQKVQQLVKSLSPEGHIDSMTEKWLSHLNR